MGDPRQQPFQVYNLKSPETNWHETFDDIPCILGHPATIIAVLGTETTEAGHQPFELAFLSEHQRNHQMDAIM